MFTCGDECGFAGSLAALLPGWLATIFVDRSLVEGAVWINELREKFYRISVYDNKRP